MADPAWPGLDADQEVAAEQAAEDQPAAADASEYVSGLLLWKCVLMLQEEMQLLE